MTSLYLKSTMNFSSILMYFCLITLLPHSAYAAIKTSIYPYELECEMTNLWMDNRGSRPEVVSSSRPLDKTQIWAKTAPDYTFVENSNNSKIFVQHIPLADPTYVLSTTLVLNNSTYGTSSSSEVTFEVRKVGDGKSHTVMNFNFGFEPWREVTDQATKERWYEDKVGQLAVYTPSFHAQLAEKNHDRSRFRKPRSLDSHKNFKGEFLGVVVNYCKLLSYQ